MRKGLLSLILLLLPWSASAVKLVVANDDWILRDTGFANAPADTAQFARNVAEFLAGGSGSIHAYSNPPTGIGEQLRSTLTDAGYVYTSGTDFELTAQNLSSFDALIITAFPVPSPDEVDVLIDYVESGGGLYVFGGIRSDAASTASALNPLLNHFGVNMEPLLNNADGVIDVTSGSHSIFDGVSGLYHLNGNNLTGEGLQVPFGEPGEALFAVLPAMPIAPVPTMSAWGVLTTTMLLGASAWMAYARRACPPQ